MAAAKKKVEEVVSPEVVPEVVLEVPTDPLGPILPEFVAPVVEGDTELLQAALENPSARVFRHHSGALVVDYQ